ncbi:hypothetical protein K402DRAFT_389615 [Aulographum hederae CBS 113979]|uniref:CENP-C homolog n=1 Tax=Aulographum hederae CBS 113979 TaxID=1176131 RepID=A0A6G1HCA0_9PEZI|nr:hypothetical protein K402DRAFT_389615 [Aulographum hederae CBS 113979]
MAPSHTPGRKKRENNYFDVGVQGRKTGLTVKDTGVRDEYGMEPLDNLFSSPEKSPFRRNTQTENITFTMNASEDMEVAQTSGIHPFEVLSGRRDARHEKTRFPPPKARSPMKTNIGSSPRRHSSVQPATRARSEVNTPNRVASQARSINRRLDFVQDIPLRSIEKDNRRSDRISAANVAARRDVYDIDTTPSYAAQKYTNVEPVMEDEPLPDVVEDYDGSSHHDDNDNGAYEDGEESMQVVQQYEPDEVTGKSVKKAPYFGLPSVEGSARQSKKRRLQELVEEQAKEEEDETPVEQPRRVPAKKRTSRAAGKRKSQSSINEEEDRSNMPPPPQPKRRKARESAAQDDVQPAVEEYNDEDADATVDEYASDASRLVPQSAAPKRKAGRPRKVSVMKDADSVIVDTADEEVEGIANGAAAPSATRKGKQTRTKAPSQQTRNARNASVADSTRKPSASVEPDASSSRTQRRPSKPRGLQILRSGTPMEETGTVRTRSGRPSVQPINYWCGERIERNFDGTMKEIIRAEDVQMPKRSASRAPSRRPGARKRAMSALEEVEEEEVDEKAQKWELEGGVLAGRVRQYDPETNSGVNDVLYEQELAIAPSGITTHKVPGSDFSYAKLFTLPFFGNGMVDIPPGGYKRAKNSRRMHMAFFVHTGRVLVSVAENEFSVGKGGVWQVPRGNMYSIDNQGKQPARVFFAQGCEVERQPEMEDEA